MYVKISINWPTEVVCGKVGYKFGKGNQARARKNPVVRFEVKKDSQQRECVEENNFFFVLALGGAKGLFICCFQVRKDCS